MQHLNKFNITTKNAKTCPFPLFLRTRYEDIKLFGQEVFKKKCQISDDFLCVVKLFAKTDK